MKNTDSKKTIVTSKIIHSFYLSRWYSFSTTFSKTDSIFYWASR